MLGWLNKSIRKKKKTNNTTKQWAKDVRKESISMENKHMKSCLTLLAIHEMQIKTMMRYISISISEKVIMF